MYRLLITFIWLIGFSTIVMGASFAVIIVLILLNYGSEDSNLVDALSAAAICILSFSAAAGVRTLWPKLAWTREGYREVVNGARGQVVSNSRFARASMGDIEIGYCFPRDFIFFNLQWSPPSYSRFRRDIQRKIETGDGWIPAIYLWRLAESLVPLVIRIAPDRFQETRVHELRERLGAESQGRVVETWIQRARRGDTIARLMDDHSGVEPQPGDDVFLLVYVEPWRASIFKRLIEVVADFAQPFRDGERFKGPGWPANFH